ncbi:MAG: hypothetical protein JNG83_03680 [Opitutaceae bacterium]|nr:hypothetical protein [Opitutaceae bacterium]
MNTNAGRILVAVALLGAILALAGCQTRPRPAGAVAASYTITVLESSDEREFSAEQLAEFRRLAVGYLAEKGMPNEGEYVVKLTYPAAAAGAPEEWVVVSLVGRAAPSYDLIAAYPVTSANYHYYPYDYGYGYGYYDPYNYRYRDYYSVPLPNPPRYWPKPRDGDKPRDPDKPTDPNRPRNPDGRPHGSPTGWNPGKPGEHDGRWRGRPDRTDRRPDGTAPTDRSPTDRWRDDGPRKEGRPDRTDYRPRGDGSEPRGPRTDRGGSYSPPTGRDRRPDGGSRPPPSPPPPRRLEPAGRDDAGSRPAATLEP